MFYLIIMTRDDEGKLRLVSLLTSELFIMQGHPEGGGRFARKICLSI